MTYRNISERWGDAVGGLTLDDYREQARLFAAEYAPDVVDGEDVGPGPCDPDLLTADADGVYYDGERIAEPEKITARG